MAVANAIFHGINAFVNNDKLHVTDIQEEIWSWLIALNEFS